MHGPKKRAGGVAAIEGVRTPSLVAKAVMEQTDHHLIVGKGAQDFARGLGFKIEDDLNTENSRKLWLDWKRRIDPKHYLDPQKRAEAGRKAMRQMVAEGLIDARHIYGTINCDGVNGKGEICGVTTTSGLSWKIPGRVGDSPILGAGLYVDGDVGAAGSTGRGEANLYNLCSFLIVENMRRGMHPKDAGLEACKRIKANTVEKRLLNSKGNPNFGINFYILNAKGEYAGVSMYPEYLRESTNEVVKTTYAVCTEKGPETLPCEALLEGRPED
jgi:N4-(beta-N-acetylglucosaminyl)-L-asparaginase